MSAGPVLPSAAAAVEAEALAYFQGNPDRVRSIEGRLKSGRLAAVIVRAALARADAERRAGDADGQTPPSTAELDRIEALGYDRETFRFRDGTYDATSADLLRRTIAARLSGRGTRSPVVRAHSSVVTARAAVMLPEPWVLVRCDGDGGLVGYPRPHHPSEIDASSNVCWLVAYAPRCGCGVARGTEHVRNCRERCQDCGGDPDGPRRCEHAVPATFRARVVEALEFDEDWEGDDEQVIADIGDRVAQADHCRTRHSAPAADSLPPGRRVRWPSGEAGTVVARPAPRRGPGAYVVWDGSTEAEHVNPRDLTPIAEDVWEVPTLPQDLIEAWTYDQDTGDPERWVAVPMLAGQDLRLYGRLWEHARDGGRVTDEELLGMGPVHRHNPEVYR